MSRSYINTLLFDSALDSIPSSLTLPYSIASSVFSPILSIVEEECDTLLGEIINLDYSVLGKVELATGNPITRARLIALLGTGATTVAVRTMSTCIAKGGVCKKCASSTYPDLFVGSTPPVVGGSIKVPSRILSDTHTVIASMGDTFFSIPYTTDQFDSVDVFIEGSYMSSSNYTITDSPTSGAVLTLTGPVFSESYFTLRFYVKSYSPYYYWLASTYAGSLFGLLSLPSGMLPARKELLKSSIQSHDLEVLENTLRANDYIPQECLDYLKGCKDSLEKVTFALLLASIYMQLS